MAEYSMMGLGVCIEVDDDIFDVLGYADLQARIDQATTANSPRLSIYQEAMTYLRAHLPLGAAMADYARSEAVRMCNAWERYLTVADVLEATP